MIPTLTILTPYTPKYKILTRWETLGKEMITCNLLTVW